MTPHNNEIVDSDPGPFSLTSEESEATLDHLHAVIDSRDPSLWTGLPLPEKRSWLTGVWEGLRELFW